MATENRKKKNTLGDDNDPPIIITGGGGVNKAAVARNRIDLDFDEHTVGRRRLRARVNTKPNITGVKVVVQGATGGTTREQTLDFPFPFELYKVTVTFATGAAITQPVKGGSKGASKKAYSKTSAASKKSK